MIRMSELAAGIFSITCLTVIPLHGSEWSV